MTPYDKPYGQYDPVGSQYSKQHQQGYTYPNQSQRSSAAAEYTEQTPARTGYQASYPTAYSSGNNTYYNSWSHATIQSANNTEDRAAEALSHLSAQDKGPSASASSASHAASGRYATYGNSYASGMNANQPPSPAVRRASSNASTAYRAAEPGRSTAPEASTYDSAYASHPAYSLYHYGGNAQSSTSNTPPVATRPSHSPATTYQYPVPPSTVQSSQHLYRPNSPYVTQQQQQQPQQPQPTGRNAKVASIQKTPAASAQPNVQDPRPANVGQPRAPSVTPSAIQQQVDSHYSHQPGIIETSAFTTVDPSQVYDRWPEQQRRIQEVEARRKAEDAARAKEEEEQRKAIEERKAAEAKKKKAEAAEKKKLEAQRKAAEEAQNRWREEETRSLEAEAEARADSYTRVQETQPQPPASDMAMGMFAPGQPGAPPPGSDLEAEMLAMFQKMREFNEKNPSMLARLWDQERRAHIAKTASPVASSPVQPAASQSAPQPTPSRASQSATAAPIPVTAPQSSRASVAARPSDLVPARTATQPPPVKNAAKSSGSGVASNAGTGPRPAPSGSAQPGSAGIWPPGKKVYLAEAAAKWLNSRSENANKQVTPGIVVTLLDANPSYLTLCETLEQMGMMVERAAFARALLSAVPEVSKGNAGPSNASTTQPMINKGSVAAAAAAVPGPPTVVTPAASAAPESTKKRRDPNASQSGSVRGRSTPAQPKKGKDGTSASKGKQKQAQPIPASNLVDLTTSSASADLGKTKRGPSLAAMYSDALTTETVAYQSELDLQAPRPFVNRGMTAQQRGSTTAPKHRYNSPYLTNKAAISQPKPPVNKEEAARKRNFAELVDLTAADDESDEELGPPAKHPNYGQVLADGNMTPAFAPGHPPGPPAFSAGSNRSFDQHTHNSFTGAVGGPAQQAVMQTPAQAEPAVLNLDSELQGKVLVERIRKGKVARKSHYDPRSICRDVLLATGRHPEMRALNQHLFDMHEFLNHHSADIEGDKFDLATIRWDQIDPGEPVVEEKPGEAESSDADDEEGEATKTANDASNDNDTNIGDPAHRRKPFAKRGRGPGRPRGSRTSKFISFVDMSRATSEGGEMSDKTSSRAFKTNATSIDNNTRRPEASLSPQPQILSFTPVNKATRMTGTPSSGPVGYAAFNQTNVQFDENGKPIKRKGRPVGWRKSIHSKAAVASGSDRHLPPPVMTSDHQKTKVPKRRGRPPKQAMPVLPPREPSPQFNVYRCEWQDCQIELHNLDTLRKHVIRLHGGKTAQGDYECFWHDCFADRSGPDNEVFVFPRMEDWLEHVEEMHLKPVARRLGDGPRIGLSEPRDSEASDAYLSDAKGRIITPKITPRGTSGDESDPGWKLRWQRELAAKRITGLSGTRLEDEKLLQQLEEKKRVVGPGLDRGGCTLANEQRRRGFYDDEDFEEIIDAEDIDEVGSDAEGWGGGRVGK